MTAQPFTLFKPGDVLDGFHFVERLHAGGMAEIWRVTREDCSPVAVLKAPLLRRNEEASAIVSFEMEQMIMPLLRGPHAPRFIASGDFSRQPYIVMELIEGTSVLRACDDLPRPFDEIAEIARGVALALADLHGQNVLHLDVKPSNIVRRNNGLFSLVDFGLSHHEKLPDLLEEEFHVPFGTSPYLAPEQVLRDRTDPRSDIFALGVMLYYFTTGVRPFGFPHSRGELEERLWRDPVPPRALRADCPPWLQEVILHCLEPDAENRYASAAQLALDLADPDQIALTARAEKLRADSFLTARKRWWARKFAPTPRKRAVSLRRASAPIIMAAVDFSGGAPANALLRAHAKKLMAATPDARLACVCVIPGAHADGDAARRHVRSLVDLRRWAASLDLPDTRATVHVLEADRPDEALLDFARQNHVDHILLLASAPSGFSRAATGPVAARVATQATCAVTLLRAPRQDVMAEGTEPSEGMGI